MNNSPIVLQESTHAGRGLHDYNSANIIFGGWGCHFVHARNINHDEFA
jgi:hypothetical protein